MELPKFNGKIYNGFCYIDGNKVAVETINKDMLIERIIDFCRKDVIGLGGHWSSEIADKARMQAQAIKGQTCQHIIENEIRYAASMRAWLKNK